MLVVAAQHLFALYVRSFGHYSTIYGSLGAVIAFMFFVYLSAEFLLFGAETASEWPRVRDRLESGDTEQGPPLRQQLKAGLRGLWKRAGKTPNGHPDAARPQNSRGDAMPRRYGGQQGRGNGTEAR